jgi:integrase
MRRIERVDLSTLDLTTIAKPPTGEKLIHDSEAVGLAWSDVLPDRLRLRDAKTGARGVPIGVVARRHLKALHRSSHIAPQVSALAGPGGYERVRTVWNSVQREAGLPPTVRIHDLRHSFAGHAIMASESLFTVARLLGHRRVQTTARYAHSADASLLAGAEKIGAAIMWQALAPSREARKLPSDVGAGGGR